jgi:hypothetical protein
MTWVRTAERLAACLTARSLAAFLAAAFLAAFAAVAFLAASAALVFAAVSAAAFACWSAVTCCLVMLARMALVWAVGADHATDSVAAASEFFASVSAGSAEMARSAAPKVAAPTV